uniref:Prestin n=1 Tax=Schistocephalus solidus TaxID=70667 RepID=A0A0X3NK04_SCHSO
MSVFLITVRYLFFPSAGMAYAMLATLPPVYGLYCSLFAPLFYFFFGTSRHLAMGTIAIVSLLVGGSLDRTIAALHTPNNTSDLLNNITKNSPTVEEETAIRVALGSALGMAVGLTQLAFGILRLGFVTRFLSDPMISGFTVGSAVHVVVSQLKTVFGLSVPRQSGLFHVPLEFYEICKKLPQTNLASLGLSLVFIALLYCFRRWINPLVMKKVKVPVPMELVVVVLGGVISYCMQLQAKHGVKVVGFVPSGLPVPCAPDLSMTVSLVADVIVIALVVFSISYSLAAVYAKKLGYAVEANQELLAYGMTNILSSFFLCFPAAASLSRSALTVSMNGMSEIAGLVGAAVVLLVVLFAGPLFYPVPNCCLSAIILVALIGMFTQMKCLPRLWRFSIWDFLSWTITFVATIFLDVIYGLIVGILFAAFSVLLRAQRQKVEVLGHFGGTEVFDSSAGYKVCEETPSIKVIRYHGSIFYACGEHFVQSIISAAGFDPRIVRFHEEKLKKGIALLERQINFNPEYKSDVGCAVSIPADIVLADGDGSHKRTQANHFTVEPAGDVIKSSESNSQHSDAPCCCNCSALCSRNNLQPVGRLLEKQASLQAHLNALTAAIPLTHIILDCAPWNFVDIVGIELLQGLIKDFNAIGVQVYLAGVSESIRQSMEQCDFFKTVEVSTLFISVFDAFMSIKVASGSPSTILSSPSPTTDILLSSGSVEISAAVAP